MSEQNINTINAEVERLRQQLAAERATNRAIAEAARNIARERDSWRAAAQRLISDRACVD